MGTKTRGIKTAGKIKSDVKKKGRQAAFNPVMEMMTRVGYGVRGVLYIVIGLLALSVVIMHRGALTDQQGAIAAIGRQPLGKIFLFIILAGLISYSLWGLIRAFFDPLRKGHGGKGLLTRAGFIVSALIYALLIPGTLRIIAGGSSSSSRSGNQQMLASVLSLPGGEVLVGLFGLVMLIVAGVQLYQGFSARFDKEYKTYHMTAAEIKLARLMGRVGLLARGVVFLVLGLLILSAALKSNSNQPVGFDAALEALLRQPYGVWVLGLVALGLMAYGVYSFMTMVWFRPRTHS